MTRAGLLRAAVGAVAGLAGLDAAWWTAGRAVPVQAAAPPPPLLPFVGCTDQWAFTLMTEDEIRVRLELPVLSC